MNAPLPPLLCRSPLKAGESLFSLLVRLARCNRYEPPAILGQLCLADLPNRKAGHPLHTATFERLTALTRIDPIQLYLATGHRFAPSLTPPDIDLASLSLPGGETRPLLPRTMTHQQLRPESAAQFCPLCLAEAAYHRLLWMPMAVTVCLEHQCLLVNQCPTCQQRVSIQDIVCRQCHRCQADLSKASSVYLGNDPFGLSIQQFIQTWLTERTVTEASVLGLPNQSAGVLYQVVHGLRLSLLELKPDWGYLHQTSFACPTFSSRRIRLNQVSPAESYILHATAFKAITHWPDRFYDLLHAYRHRLDTITKHDLPMDFSYLYTHCLEKRWQHPAFQFVQDAFNQYLVDHYARMHAIVGTRRYWAISDRLAYISIFAAAELLETSFHFVLQLIGAGELTGYPPQDPDYLPHPFVEQAEVFDWYGRHMLISIAKTAQRLNLLPEVVRDLVKMGLLEAEDNPQVGPSHLGHIRKKSLDLFLQNISVRLSLPRGRTLDLTMATKMLSDVGLNEASLLKLVMRRMLRAYYYATYPPDLSKLLFAKSDIETLARKTGAKSTKGVREPATTPGRQFELLHLRGEPV